MKRSLIAFALTLAAAAAAQAQEQGAADETQRDANQQERIEQGLQSGQLPTKEAGNLERQEQHIDRQEAHDLRSGGALTPREKGQINREQNHVSSDIYRDKHNGVTGNPNSARGMLDGTCEKFRGARRWDIFSQREQGRWGLRMAAYSCGSQKRLG